MILKLRKKIDFMIKTNKYLIFNILIIAFYLKVFYYLILNTINFFYFVLRYIIIFILCFIVLSCSEGNFEVIVEDIVVYVDQTFAPLSFSIISQRTKLPIFIPRSSIQYEVSDVSVAFVNVTGNVAPVRAGNTKITITYQGKSGQGNIFVIAR